MKKKLLFLPLLAAMALTGCQNDDPNPGNNANEGKDYGYVAVNIVQSKSMGPNAKASRAASTGFEYGSADENEAQTGLFFIFNADGNQKYGPTQEITLNGTGTGNSPEVERIYNAVLVIDGVNNKPTDAKQIVCVLNAPAGLAGEDITTLAQLEEKIADYATDRTTKGTFIMTNSVYKDGNKVLGAVVQDANIAKSAAEALNNPVEIYVERVVAKVRAQAGGTFTNNGATANVDGTATTFTINVTGIEVANIATTSYLFKNIDGIKDNAAYDWAWDATNKRSYWETVPAELAYSNKSYTAIVGDSKPAEGDFDIANASWTEYIQPNTSAVKTSILVTAELLKDGEPFNMVYLRGGYFTPDNALALIASYVANNNFWKSTGENSYSQLSASDFEWKNNEDLDEASQVSWLERYEVVARVKDGFTLFQKDGDNYTPATADDINNLLKGKVDSHPYVARVFTDGKCYYFVNIDQSSIAGAEAHTYDGVVRNHIYDLALNSIEGIGTPVFDPEDIIIPERPDDEELWYLSARVNVLAWKLVSQTIDFN